MSNFQIIGGLAESFMWFDTAAAGIAGTHSVYLYEIKQQPKRFILLRGVITIKS